MQQGYLAIPEQFIGRRRLTMKKLTRSTRAPISPESEEHELNMRYWNTGDMARVSLLTLSKELKDNWPGISCSMLPEDDPRPPDWFSSKRCMKMYNKILEKMKIKHACYRDQTPEEVLNGNIEGMRAVHLQGEIDNIQIVVCQIQSAMEMVNNGVVDRDLEFLAETLDEIEEAFEGTYKIWQNRIPPPIPSPKRVATTPSRSSPTKGKASSPRSEDCRRQMGVTSSSSNSTGRDTNMHASSQSEVSATVSQVSPRAVTPPQPFFNPTSALATAAARQLAVATAALPQNYHSSPRHPESSEACITTSSSASTVSSVTLSAPTLSKLLEMPPSVPGKLPPLPTAFYSSDYSTLTNVPTVTAEPSEMAHLPKRSVLKEQSDICKSNIENPSSCVSPTKGTTEVIDLTQLSSDPSHSSQGLGVTNKKENPLPSCSSENLQISGSPSISPLKPENSTSQQGGLPSFDITEKHDDVKNAKSSQSPTACFNFFSDEDKEDAVSKKGEDNVSKFETQKLAIRPLKRFEDLELIKGFQMKKDLAISPLKEAKETSETTKDPKSSQESPDEVYICSTSESDSSTSESNVTQRNTSSKDNFKSNVKESVQQLACRKRNRKQVYVERDSTILDVSFDSSEDGEAARHVPENLHCAISEDKLRNFPTVKALPSSPKKSKKRKKDEPPKTSMFDNKGICQSPHEAIDFLSLLDNMEKNVAVSSNNSDSTYSSNSITSVAPTANSEEKACVKTASQQPDANSSTFLHDKNLGSEEISDEILEDILLAEKGGDYSFLGIDGIMKNEGRGSSSSDSDCCVIDDTETSSEKISVGSPEFQNSQANAKKNNSSDVTTPLTSQSSAKMEMKITEAITITLSPDEKKESKKTNSQMQAKASEPEAYALLRPFRRDRKGGRAGFAKRFFNPVSGGSNLTSDVLKGTKDTYKENITDVLLGKSTQRPVIDSDDEKSTADSIKTPQRTLSRQPPRAGRRGRRGRGRAKKIHTEIPYASENSDNRELSVSKITENILEQDEETRTEIDESIDNEQENSDTQKKESDSTTIEDSGASSQNSEKEFFTNTDAKDEKEFPDHRGESDTDGNDSQERKVPSESTDEADDSLIKSLSYEKPLDINDYSSTSPASTLTSEYLFSKCKEDKDDLYIYNRQWSPQSSAQTSQSAITPTTSDSSDETENTDDSEETDQTANSNENSNSSKKKKKRCRKKDRESQNQYKTWKKAISIIWREASYHKYANVFSQKVTDDVAPGYESIVNRPMDLSLIKRNIDNGTITTTQEFHRDMLLMFQNAIMYNSSDHDVYHMAVEMQRDVIKQIQDFLATQLIIQDKIKETSMSTYLRTARMNPLAKTPHRNPKGSGQQS